MSVTKIHYRIIQMQGLKSQPWYLTSQKTQHRNKKSAIKLIIWSVSYSINGHLYRILSKLKQMSSI